MRLAHGLAVLALAPAGLQAVWSPPTTLSQRETLRSPFDSASASISADGRYVAFASRSSLDRADTNHLRDIYVLDRATGGVTLESRAADGGPWGTDCGTPRISGDGQHLAFEVVTPIRERGEPERARIDIMMRNRRTGRTVRVSSGVNGAAPDGWSRGAAVSHDGRVVVFSSTATNLVPGADANGVGEDVFVADMTTRQIRRVSLDDAGRQGASGASFAPAISGDGRTVVFSSTADLTHASRPAGSDGRAFSQVFLREIALGRTILVSAAGRVPGNGPSSHASVSADGRAIAFVSEATNLGSDDENRAADVFVWDRPTAALALVSRAAKSRTANAWSTHPALSADGRVVVFQSLASNLICAPCTAADEDINLLWDVFVLERASGRMTRLSGDPQGCWLEASTGPAVDGAGRTVVFSSLHPVDETDQGVDDDLYVRAVVGSSPSPR